MKIKMLCESVDVDEVFKEPFFESFSEVRFYRGVRKAYHDITEMEFKFRTKPLDSSPIIHNKINELSEKIFGVPVRNLIFTYTEFEAARAYGDVVEIVPKGNNFKIFYNPYINDLTANAGLKPENLYEHMWDDLVDAFGNMNYVEDMIGEYWEIGKSIGMAIEEISFHTTDIIREFESYLNTKLPGLLNLVAKEHNTADDRLDELHHFIETSNIIDNIIDIFKELMDEFIEQIATEYLDNVDEVDEEDEMDLSNNPEVMIYAPDGFYVIPSEDW